MNTLILFVAWVIPQVIIFCTSLWLGAYSVRTIRRNKRLSMLAIAFAIVGVFSVVYQLKKIGVL
jgi:Kef-type K+ transport system membrane component KefB